MFDFVRKHTRVLQFILVLLIFPSFVILGFQGYSGMSESKTDVARIGDVKISRAEFDNALRVQADRVRAQAPTVDARFFDGPEFKRRVIDTLINEQVLTSAAQELNLVPGDLRLARRIASDPQFAPFIKDGRWNADLLAAQGQSPASIEYLVRQQYARQQVVTGIVQTGFVPKAPSQVALDAVFQRREVQFARFDAKDFAERVNPTEDDLKKYYADPANAAAFQAPEQASVEYAVLDLKAIQTGLRVSEEELRNFYQQNEQRFTEPEERRARHILVKVEADAKPEQRKAARAKADALLADARKNPAGFADLARKNSDDPGSAANGGDLDFFGKGSMVKPFEDAVFALKPGQISDIVETDFGFHIIQLEATRGGTRQPFEAVRAQIEDEVKRQMAQKAYADAAERFTNIVYEQSDSLKPAADELKLTLRQAANVTRTPSPALPPELTNAKLLQALFSADGLKDKRNTEAVETGPNQMVSARIVQYSPARKLPFDEVKDRVRERVAAAQQANLAKDEAQRQLTAWQAAPDGAKLGGPVLLSHGMPSDLPRPLAEAALKAATDKLPAWQAVDLGNNQGWAVLRVNKILPSEVSADNAAEAGRQFSQVWATAEGQAYMEALKNRYKAKILPAGQAAIDTPADAAAAP